MSSFGPLVKLGHAKSSPVKRRCARCGDSGTSVAKPTEHMKRSTAVYKVQEHKGVVYIRHNFSSCVRDPASRAQGPCDDDSHNKSAVCAAGCCAALCVLTHPVPPPSARSSSLRPRAEMSVGGFGAARAADDEVQGVIDQVRPRDRSCPVTRRAHAPLRPRTA